jgi:uncharacterized membrane protein YqgA involved in biofilm formation
MLILMLITAILTVAEVFFYKKNNKLGWIIPIITGIYLVYSAYNVIKFQDLTYIDMLPSLIFFVPATVALVVCKTVIKK